MKEFEKEILDLEQTEDGDEFYENLEQIIDGAHKGKIFINNTITEEKSLIVEFAYDQLPQFDKIKLLISNKTSNVRWLESINMIEFSKGNISINLERFINRWFKPDNSRWAFSILAQKDEEYYFYILKGKKQKQVNVSDKLRIYLDFITKEEWDGVRWGMRPYYSEYWTLSIQAIRIFRSFIKVLEGEAVKVSIRFGKVEIKAKLNDYGFKPVGMVMRYRNSSSLENNRNEFQCEICKEGNAYYIYGSLNLKSFTFKDEYGDILIHAVKDGEIYDFFLNTKEFGITRQFQKLFQPVRYRINKEFIFFPYVTVYDQLAFDYRKIEVHDSFFFRLKERIAKMIYRLNKKKLDDKNIMLIYEKFCYAAQENGLFFFQYCLENGMEEYMNKEIYYVIDYKSPQYKNVKIYGDKVLNYLSIKYMVYLLAAKLFVSSETKNHSYARRCNGSSIRRSVDKTPSVFLQHGVIAFKRLAFLNKENRNSRTNLFITSSYIEKNIVVEKLAYKEKEVAVTGLARWDLLEDKSGTGKEILLMPTWRKELESLSDEEFEQSVFFEHYMNLLNSEKLYSILEKYDLQLNFYMHPYLRQFIRNFSSGHPNIHLISFGEQPLNELIMRCSMMITDYSSAIWDAYYLGKPALFYQFDIEDYSRTQGSYFDLETDLFGDAVYNQEDLLKEIEEMAIREFKEKEEYAKLREKYLPYIDHDNRKRTCEAILKAGI